LTICAWLISSDANNRRLLALMSVCAQEVVNRGDLCLCRGIDIQIWQKFHWFIVFYISIWGLSPLSAPSAAQLMRNQKVWSNTDIIWEGCCISF